MLKKTKTNQNNLRIARKSVFNIWIYLPEVKINVIILFSIRVELRLHMTEEELFKRLRSSETQQLDCSRCCLA